MQSALLTNFKVLLALLFRDIVHQISKLEETADIPDY